MIVNFLRRTAMLLTTALVFIAVIVSCNDSGMTVRTSLNGSAARMQNADGMGSVWVDYESAISDGDFTLRQPSSSAVPDAKAEFRTERDGDDTVITVISQDSIFHGIMARVTPDDPRLVFTSAKWSDSLEGNSRVLKLVAPFESSVDFGVCGLGLSNIDGIASGEPIISLHFKKLQDAPA